MTDDDEKPRRTGYRKREHIPEPLELKGEKPLSRENVSTVIRECEKARLLSRSEQKGSVFFRDRETVERLLGYRVLNVTKIETLRESKEGSNNDGVHLCMFRNSGAKVLVVAKEFKEMKVEEIYFLAGCKHPNVVTFHGFWIPDERKSQMPWPLTEYERFGSLKSRYEALFRPDVPERTECIVSVVKDLIRGLVYLHDTKRIVHGDIAARNVVMGSLGVAKWTDFGHSEEARTKELTDSEIEGQKDDIWKLGLMIVKICGGRLDTKRIGEVDEDVLLSFFPCGEDQGLKEIPEFLPMLLRCLQKHPKNRPSAKELGVLMQVGECPSSKTVCGKILELLEPEKKYPLPDEVPTEWYCKNVNCRAVVRRAENCPYCGQLKEEVSPQTLIDGISRGKYVRIIALPSTLDEKQLRSVVTVLRTSTTIRIVSYCEGYFDLTSLRAPSPSTWKATYQGYTSTHTKLLSPLLTGLPLTEIDISSNGFSSDASEFIISLLHSPQLRKLVLSWNHLGDQGVSQICEALGSNTSLLELDLRHNHIGDKGASLLAKALSRNKSLMVLDLELNANFQKQVLVSLAEAERFYPGRRIIHKELANFKAIQKVRQPIPTAWDLRRNIKK